MKYITILLILPLLLVGCSHTNITNLMKAIGENHNAWCAKGQIGTVYGTESNFIGKGSADTSVEVGPDKCVITGSQVQKNSGTNTIQVPVEVPAHNLNLTPAK